MNPEFYCLTYATLMEHNERLKRGLGTIWSIHIRAWLLHLAKEENQ